MNDNASAGPLDHKLTGRIRHVIMCPQEYGQWIAAREKRISYMRTGLLFMRPTLPEPETQQLLRFGLCPRSSFHCTFERYSPEKRRTAKAADRNL